MGDSPHDRRSPAPGRRRGNVSGHRRQGRVSARLPGHVRARGAREERGRYQGHGRRRSCSHRRRSMHQGGPLHRAYLPSRSPAASDAPYRQEGRRAVREDQLGDGDRRGGRAPQGDRRRGSGADSALQLCRNHGLGAGRIDVHAILSQAGRELSGPHDLRLGGYRGPRDHAGAAASASMWNWPTRPS